LLTVVPTFSACFPIVSEACLKVSEPTPWVAYEMDEGGEPFSIIVF
jgi:hypothetical protein